MFIGHIYAPGPRPNLSSIAHPIPHKKSSVNGPDLLPFLPNNMQKISCSEFKKFINKEAYFNSFSNTFIVEEFAQLQPLMTGKNLRLARTKKGGLSANCHVHISIIRLYMRIDSVKIYFRIF